jgi:rod shape-determining protein MreD
VLAVIPLPSVIDFLRPLWVPVLLICWVLKFPTKVGFIPAFIIGFFLDVLYGVPLGTHSIALVLIVYLLIKFDRRFLFFSFWQKMTTIFCLIIIYSLPSFFYELMTAKPVDFKLYLFPAITSVLLWPGILFLLDKYSTKLELR